MFFLIHFVLFQVVKIYDLKEMVVDLLPIDPEEPFKEVSGDKVVMQTRNDVKEQQTSWESLARN